MTNAPIMDHPLWSLFRRYIHVSVGSQNQSHMTVLNDTPNSVRQEMLHVRVKCGFCELLHHPFRQSPGSRGISMFITGPRRDGHWRCSYHGIIRAMALTIFYDLSHKDDVTVPLSDQVH